MPLTKVKSGGVSDSITLTSPDINAPDIDGGTIDNAVIGGSTAAAGSFTTITATGGSSSNWNTAYGWGDHSTQSYATQTYVGTEVSNLVDSSPAALNTLNELAAALGDDPNFATTVTNSIALKAPLASPSFTGNVLVGRTSASFGSDTGLVLRPNNDSYIIANDSPSLTMRRNNSDGAIAQFYRDGTAVGSIGVHSSSLQIGTGNTQIKFSDAEDSFYVVNALGQARDTSHDLGKTGARFKDLYLSGIANIGSWLRFGGGSNYYVHSDNANYLRFGTAGAERIRISSAGHTMFATTDDAPGAGNTQSGVAIRGGSDNRSFFSANSNYVAAFNRNTNDGPIVEFNKNGTTVGIIGTNAATMFVAAPQAGGMKYSYYDSTNAVMLPVTTTGANADATHDLGYASARFRNLYLSGGVYLGGTGAANKLDDYEEGTFTPEVQNGTYTYSNRRGHYVKIGNMVYVHIGLRIATASSVTSAVGRITGLPFTSNNYGSYQEPHARIGVGGGFVTSNLGSHLSFYVDNNQTRLMARTSAVNADTPVASNAMWQNGTFIKLTVIYTVS